MDSYSTSDFEEIMRMLDAAADAEEHEKRRPRETKYDTTAFYNFRKKKNKRRKM